MQDSKNLTVLVIEARSETAGHIDQLRWGLATYVVI